MYLRHVLAPIVLFALCVNGATGGPVLHGRQDSTDIATDTTAASSQVTGDATNTATTNGESPSSSADSSSLTASATSTPSSKMSNDASQTTQKTTMESWSASATVAAAASATSTVSSTATSSPKGLPLQPEITPAIGVAGVLLLIAGAALCLIGIKHRWLHIFLSTALLASLAVTVLIVYVMNPPVADAIQGAYLVAVVFTGLIFGAVAIVFKDVTEGLGCLLGGFCVAMWFSVLRPGGLIESTTGRAILILVFSAVGFLLSFSSYTRAYSLIVLTAFAGAEVTVLGVDCFSRAGLKEFWLYIWNLNDNQFPLNTQTYPITRGMKVEIACTIVLFVFGVLSQLKIWKIVKERRDKKEAERAEDDERRNQLEEAVGKEIEHNNERDRAQWEAVYGDKDVTRVQVDSGVGSSIESFPKRSTSVREREVDAIEMADIPRRTSKQKGKPTVTVREASDDGASQPRGPTQSEENLLSKYERSGAASSASFQPPSEVADSTYDIPAETTSTKDWSQRSSAERGPAVTPLPFTIPGDEPEEEVVGSDHQSEVTAGISVLERRGMPLRQLSLQQHDRSLAALETPRIEDDRASSIAATADDIVDLDAASLPRLSHIPSPAQSEVITSSLRPPPIPNNDYDMTKTPRMSMIEAPVDEEDDEAIVRPPTTMDDYPKREAAASPVRERPQYVSSESQRQGAGSRRTSREHEADEEFDNMSAVGSLKDHLPQSMSKVAMIYRTNEWAKHAADALEPAAVEDDESPSPGVRVDPIFADEAAKAAEWEKAKPAPPPAPAPTPVQPARKASTASSSNPYRRSSQPTPNTASRPPSVATTPVYAFQRSASQMSLQRKSSAPSIAQPSLAPQSSRNFSAPLSSQPMIESPIEEEEEVDESAPAHRMTLASRTVSTGNLMDERTDRLKRQPTTMSFNVIAPSDSASVHALSIDDNTASPVEAKQPQISDEDMTLAQRKALIQQQSRDSIRPTPSPIQNRQSTTRKSTWPAPAPGPSRMSSQMSMNNYVYDSHQPKRTNTVDSVRQSHMLQQWRQSVQQDVQAKQPQFVEEGARVQMLNERRQAEWAHQREQSEKEKRQSAMDVAARSGQLHGAHRDAMRKMQAKANGKGT